MASTYKDATFGNSQTSRSSRDYSFESPPTASSASTPSGAHFVGGSYFHVVPEPVTPPASVHHSSIHAKSNGFPQSAQMREQRKSMPTYPSAVLASPIDTPRNSATFSSQTSPTSYHVANLQYYSAALQQQLQQSHLASPHTPFSSALSSVQLTPNTAPLWPLNTSTASANSSAATSSPAGHTNTTSPSTTTFDQPVHTHTRNYSYTPMDFQPNLSKLQISSASSSASNEGARARAYSYGMSNIVPITGSPNAAVGSGTTNGSSSSSNPFPPPLSSPLSPVSDQNLGLSNRRSFPHFMPLNEESASLHQSTRRTSPPQSLFRAKSRRSSSNGSVIDFSNLSMDNPSLLHDEGLHTTGVDNSALQSQSAHNKHTNVGGISATGTIGGGQIVGVNYFPNSATILQSSDSHIFSLCRDQRGCRFLQRLLDEDNPAVCRRVFDATHSYMVRLMMDPFGNYFCQKLFTHCNSNDITLLLKVCGSSLPDIAVNQHGTRALQKLIDRISTQEQVDILIGALDGHVVRLIRDLNGNHVIQKLLLSLDERGSQFIYDAACESVVEIGSHRHGCCVLQRCLDYAQEKNRIKLISHIIKKALILVCDPFGNYVCQYVIDHSSQEHRDAMIQSMLGKIGALSVQKFSSNVVEKCFRAASPALRHQLLAEIMDPDTFRNLIMDNYGNYVIQTALDSTKSLDKNTKRQLATSIHTALVVTRSPYGRRIMSKLKAW